MLGNWWGFTAGWMFLIANTVGPGVSALAFGSYLHALWPVIPDRLVAISAAAVMIALNALGIRRSVKITGVIVIISIVSLVAVALIGLPFAHVSNFSPFHSNGVLGVLQATGLLFFAYTGYSRIATLVEEVHNPKRTIPRASMKALGSVSSALSVCCGNSNRRVGGFWLSWFIVLFRHWQL